MPRGRALGMVMQLPDGDQVSATRRQMLARMDVCMGGRVAEELVLGADNVTSGASNDILQATRLATAMVTKYGPTFTFPPPVSLVPFAAPFSSLTRIPCLPSDCRMDYAVYESACSALLTNIVHLAPHRNRPLLRRYGLGEKTGVFYSDDSSKLSPESKELVSSSHPTS